MDSLDAIMGNSHMSTYTSNQGSYGMSEFYSGWAQPPSMMPLNTPHMQPSMNPNSVESFQPRIIPSSQGIVIPTPISLPAVKDVHETYKFDRYENLYGGHTTLTTDSNKKIRLDHLFDD